MLEWKMSFGTSGAFKKEKLPEALKPYYRWATVDGVINGGKDHHLMGLWEPTQDVLDAISGYFNQYLELKMPLNRHSFVWPSQGLMSDGPIRCPSDEAINHFYCSL